MSAIATCAYCGGISRDIKRAIEARRLGEPVYCDAACRAADASPLGAFVRTSAERCRHRSGVNVQGRCLDCGAVERRK
jgi:hypothetical protein